MKNQLILSATIAILAGCASASYQTATANISAEAAAQVVDGSTTKTEIFSLFGEPNGFNPTMGGGTQDMMRMSKMSLSDDSPYDKIMHYKNCIMTASAKIMGPFSVGSGTAEVCDTFTALVNEQDIVVAHSYVENNVLKPENVAKIQQNTSYRKDVIRALGGPNSIVIQKDKELYIYKNCITKSNMNSWGGTGLGMALGKEAQTNRSNCQQASIIMDKSSGKVLKTNFIPFRKK